MTSADRRVGWKRKAACLMAGHQREWASGILGLTWTCSRCGRTGDLKDASKMPLGQHALHLLTTAVVALLAWLLIRALLGD